MKRHVYKFTIKRYSSIEEYDLVSTTLDEAIKRMRVVYRKIKGTVSFDIIGVEQRSEVYV